MRCRLAGLIRSVTMRRLSMLPRTSPSVRVARGLHQAQPDGSRRSARALRRGSRAGESAFVPIGSEQAEAREAPLHVSHLPSEHADIRWSWRC
jgi:hypothetical protein